MQIRTSLLLSAQRQYFGTLFNSQIRCSSSINSPEKGKESAPLKFVQNQIKKKFSMYSDAMTIVKNGFLGLFRDGKDIFVIQNKLGKSATGVRSLNYKELELYYEGWYSVHRLIPLIILGVLPMGNAVVIILALSKPLKFLSPHFWTDRQKELYKTESHRQRVRSFKLIIEHLNAGFSFDEKSNVHRQWNEILQTLKDGRIPSVKNVISCSKLFEEGGPYSLPLLTPTHVDDLLAMHNFKKYIGKVNRLEEWASYLILMDQKIKIGKISMLTEDQLKKRGVNADNMSADEMKKWLGEWVDFGSHTEKHNFSLILHAPAIFGYGHPSNRSILSDYS